MIEGDVIMLKKSTKIWFVLLIVFVVIVLIVGKNKKDLVTSCGLAEATTWDKLAALDIPVANLDNVVLGDNGQWDVYQALVEMNQQDDIISVIKEIQKILIEKVLQGDPEQVGKTVMFYQYSPFRIQSGKISCESSSMLLQPGRKYLLFLKPSDLNKIWKKEIYYSDAMIFSFLTLDREIPLLEKKENYRFNELNGIEFLSDSERIIEQANKLRKKILDYYSLE